MPHFTALDADGHCDSAATELDRVFASLSLISDLRSAISII
jgi:hypothetical protein